MANHDHKQMMTLTRTLLWLLEGQQDTSKVDPTVDRWLLKIVQLHHKMRTDTGMLDKPSSQDDREGVTKTQA